MTVPETQGFSERLDRFYFLLLTTLGNWQRGHQKISSFQQDIIHYLVLIDLKSEKLCLIQVSSKIKQALLHQFLI